MYRLEIHKQAAKYYSRLEPNIRSKINAVMKAIMGNPTEGLHVKRVSRRAKRGKNEADGQDAKNKT